MDFKRYEDLINIEIGKTNVMYLAIHYFRLEKARKELDEYFDKTFSLEEIIDSIEEVPCCKMKEYQDVSSKLNNKINLIQSILKNIPINIDK